MHKGLILMKKIKVLMLILLSIIFILEVGIILVQRGALSSLAKEKITKELSKRLKCEVKIGRIDLEYPKKAILYKLRFIFSDSTTLSAKEVVLFYDLREVIAKREEFSLGNLKRVELVSPVLLIPFGEREREKDSLPSKLSTSFKGKIFLRNGLFKIVDQKGQAASTLRKIGGGLDFSQPHPSFSLKGELLPNTSLLLSGQIDPSPLEISFDLTADTVDLKAFSSYLKEVEAKGALADFCLKGKLSKEGLNYQIETTLKKADLKMANLKEPFKEIEGTILIDKGRSGVRGQGSGIRFRWQDRSFLGKGNLSLEGRRAKLLLSNLSFGEFRLGRIEIEGDLDRKRKAFIGRLVAKELGLPYLKEGEEIESNLKYEKDGLELTALKIGEEVKGNLKIKGLNHISALAYEGSLRYKGTGPKPLKAEVSFKGRGKEAEISSLEIAAKDLRVKAKGRIAPSLDISGHIDDLCLGKDRIRSSFGLKGSLSGLPSDIHLLASLDLKGLFLNEEEIGEAFAILDGKRDGIRAENLSVKKKGKVYLSCSSGLLQREKDGFSLKFDNLKVVDLSLSKGFASFRSGKEGIILDEFAAALQGGGNIDLKGFLSNDKIDLSLSLDSVRLADLPYQTGLAAKVGGKLKIGGDRKNPDLEADLILENGNWANLPFSRANLRFSFKDDIFLIDDLFVAQEDGTCNLNQVSLDLRPGGRVKVLGKLSNFGTEKTKLSLGLELEGTREKSSIKGTAALLDFSINDRLNFKKILTRIEVRTDLRTLEFIPISEEGILSGKIGFADKIRFSNITLTKPPLSTITLNGEIDPVSKLLNLDSSLKQVEIGLLTKHAKFIKEAKGKADISLSLGGSFSNPSLNGRITLLNGEASLLFLEDRLTNLSLDAQIVDNRLLIHKLKAEVGKEEILITSKEGSTPAKLDILAKSTGFIRVSLPDFLAGQAKLSFNFLGTLGHPRASGQIWLKETTFTYPIPTKSKSALGALPSIDWDIKLIVDKNVRYNNEFVNVELNEEGWLRLIKKGKGRFVVAGGEMTAKRGRIEYLGTGFEVKEATLKFIEGNRNPYLSGTAETKVDETLILLAFDGFLFETEPQLLAPESFPALSQEEIVKLLRYGKDYSEGELDLLMKAGVAKMIGRGLTTSLVNPLEKRLAEILRADIQLKFPYVERVIQRAISEDNKEEELKFLEEKCAVSEFSYGKYILEDLYLKYHGSLHSTEEEKLLHLGLTSEWELQYLIPTGEAIKYKYRQKNGQEEEEHKIILEKEIKF